MGRLLAAGFLVVVALVTGAVAFGALQNLWADYQDSPTSTYLLIGLPLLTFSLAALVSAVAVLLRKN